MVDEIYLGDARSMDRVQPSSVALVVTSPPYFAGKQYEEELGAEGIPASYTEYIALLEAVFAECVAKLEPGGRIAVNVANLGRKPYRSLSADVIGILQDKLGLLLRGEVVWRKARGAGGTARGARSAARPTRCCATSPSGWSWRRRAGSTGRSRGCSAEREGLPHVATTTADEFMEATLDVWELAPESATRVGHPAPFPVELPQRFLELYTYEGDVVLDPFMGSGSTAVAAVRTGRHFLGYDTDPAYVDAARARVAAERDRLLAAERVDRRRWATRRSTGRPSCSTAAGFAVDAKSKRKSGGVDVSARRHRRRRARVAGRRRRRVHDRPPGPAAHRRPRAHARPGGPAVRLRGRAAAGAGHRRAAGAHAGRARPRRGAGPPVRRRAAGRPRRCGRAAVVERLRGLRRRAAPADGAVPPPLGPLIAGD